MSNQRESAMQAWFKRQSTRKKYAMVVAIALVLLVIAVPNNDGKDDSKKATSNATATTAAASDTTTTATTEAAEEAPVEAQPTIEDAQALVDEGKYDQAVVLVKDSSANTKNRVRAYAATTIAAAAVVALDHGDRKLASRRIRKAASYANTATVRSAQGRLKRAQSRAAARRVAARQRSRERAAERRRAASDAAAAAAEEAAVAAPAAESYAGLTCTEIGHSFSVTPGSDPDHDANNDGLACESQ
jgi:Tfp pilus assembly protein FimT